MLPIISGLIVSVDALFIGISLGSQERCKYAYLAIINAVLLGLCFLGFFIAEQVYELIPFEPDYIVGGAFIALGAWYIIHHFTLEKVKKKKQVDEQKMSMRTIVITGLIMSLEAMLITMGITFVFGVDSTFLIPLTVALAHFVYSTVTFYLARTKHIRNLPDLMTHIISGGGLIIYGLMAIFLEIDIY